MQRWLKVVSYISMVVYFVFVPRLAVRLVDPLYQGISPLRFSLIMMACSIIAYPLFIWHREPTRRWFGRLSFSKWCLLTLVIGVLGAVWIAFSSKVVN